MKLVVLVCLLLASLVWALPGGPVWSGSLFPLQDLPVDPNYIEVDVVGTRWAGSIHLHIWGPSTLNVTEFNTTVAGNSASDVEFDYNVRNGEITLADYENNQGPYNFGNVTRANASGYWHLDDDIEWNTHYNLHIVRGPIVSEIELDISISGKVTRHFFKVSLEATSYTDGVAYINRQAAPYQALAGIANISSERTTVAAAYRTLSPYNWVNATCCLTPVASYPVLGEILHYTIVQNNMYGRINLRTAGPLDQVRITDAVFQGSFTSSPYEPNKYTLEKVYVTHNNGTRYMTTGLQFYARH